MTEDDRSKRGHPDLGTRLRALELPAPEWIVELVRPQPARVPWLDMARAAVVVTTPLAAGVAVHQPGIGVVLTMGALPTTISDRGGPLWLRARRGLLASLAGALGLLIGHLLAGTGWIAVPAIGAISVVSARISVLGAIPSLAGLQLLVFTVVGSGISAPLPPLETSLVFLIGATWALAGSAVQALIDGPRTPERTAVAAVYRAVAKLLLATGTARAVEARQALTTAFDSAYDLLLGARARASGRDPETRRLASLLNAATGLLEPSVAIAHAGGRPPAALGTAASNLAEAIERDQPPPALPPEDGEEDPLLAELRAGLSSARSRFTRIPPGELSTRRPSLWAQGLGTVEHLLVGREGWIFAARLALCMSLAGIARELVPLGRGYWVLLTTALVLKPDFGSVFARAIQRALGTLVGVLIAALLLGLLRPGLLLLACVPLLAALLPYSVRRNYGLFAAFLTPIAILLLDFGLPVDPSIVGVRLLDTLLGCVIVLVAGYLLWPETWRVRLGGRVADAADLLADYLEAAFGGSAARRRQLRRRTYSDLADVRVAMQRSLAEPPPMRTRAMAWWPVILQLERAADAVTEASIRARGGEPAPDPPDLALLAAALRDLEDALRDQRSPNRLPVPGDGVLAGVADEVRTARRLASRRLSDGPDSSGQAAPDPRRGDGDRRTSGIDRSLDGGRPPATSG